ncbi:hypothetical protein BDV95DRAFT_648073 [Massariosphaeria phaeospora]|uniref:BZIP domain-containing protein n=1 Tax=Massariosphaeria phaeospora TaxID=100035 RepID=A0A7C8I045_9PLEO|nr:hypothetical protein BDV95DRAFT_648073 [Massariosphaeria phaeospora]
MTSSITLELHPASRPARRGRRVGDPSEPSQKPKKVNSEIRKQQNRIASRNYREKRKRKLQYLQQLLRDQPSEEQTHSTPEPTQEDDTEALSVGYHPQQHTVTALSFSPDNDYSSLASTTGSVYDDVTAAAFEDSLLATTHAYTTYESTWNAPIYAPQAPADISSWNVPHWMANIHYTPQMTPAPEDFQFTPPPTQHVFEQLPTPPHQPHEHVSNADMFMLNSTYSRQPDQPQSISSVSLRSSAPYSNPVTYFPHSIS